MKNQVSPQAVARTCRRVSKPRVALLLLGTLFGLAASSQSFIGYGYDNYSGINGVVLNPASIAGSKYKVNVNIISASAFGGNNAYELDRSRLFALKFSNLAEGDGYYKINKPEYKYLYTNIDILGPSAMFNIDRRDAIGIITRVRSVGNVYNLGNSLFQLLGNSDPAFYNVDIINRSLQSKVNTFAEAGLSFGRILMEGRTSRLKVGFTAKYLAGLSYGSLSSGQMTINIDPLNNIAKLSADVTTQYSPNLDDLGGGASISHVFNKQSGKGWGLDLGMVYEWIPEGNDGYKLRMGLSLTDLGSINYNNSKNGQTYTMNADGHNTSELQRKDGETYDQYFNRLQTAGLIIAKVNGVQKTKVNLPTSLHLNADYNVYKKIFINGDVLLNMVATTNQVTPNYNTTFTITPRLEKKWVSIYSPVSYNAQGMLNWGAGVRFGPLFVGSGTVFSSLLKKRIQTADVHVGLTIPIFQSKKNQEKKDDKKKSTDTLYRKILITHDRDSDGVVDEKDACPDSAGPVALIGCPDSDGDGVPNNRDKCPGVKGSPNFEGCPAPDTDGDGVNDDDDKCPLTKGTMANHGCPPISPDLVRSVSRAADRVFFIRAKADVEEISFHELDRVAAILQADSTLRLHIQGHTDSEGTDERNQSLSLRRAKTVKAYLVSKGVAASRLDCRAYGSKHPIAPNSTPEGMAQNRRVDMELANWE